jgi:hypothetical protein
MDGVDVQGLETVVSPFDEGLDRALGQATELIESCLLALERVDLPVTHGVRLLRKAERWIGSIRIDHHLPDNTASALMAARDTLSAHLLARTMLTEGGAAPGVGRGILRRGAVDCQAILNQIRHVHSRQLVPNL